MYVYVRQKYEGLLGDSSETGAEYLPAASEASSGVSAAHGRGSRWKNCTVRIGQNIRMRLELRILQCLSIRYYDEDLQQQRYIHFISHPALNLRLLEHFYTFLHFQDP